jgi:S-adenosylmethionine synthetase
VIADRLANHLVSQLAGIAEAEVQIISCIGQPVDTPQLVAIKMVPKDILLVDPAAQEVHEVGKIVEIVHKEFSQIKEITHQLVLGKIHLF